MSDQTEKPVAPLRVLELPKPTKPAAIDYVACGGCEFWRVEECFIDPPRVELDPRDGLWSTSLEPNCPAARPACARYLPRGSRAAHKETPHV